jgi:flagellar biosynthetic protein FliP
MSPVISQINETAYQPYVKEQIPFEEFTDKAMIHLREFMPSRPMRRPEFL